MITIKVKVIATNEIKIAVYAPNKKGNMQYNVEGKFYTDKQFDKLFIIINN